MKRKLGKYLLVLLGICLLLQASTLLLAKESVAAEKATIKFWYMYGGEEGVLIREFIERFNKLNPDIKVEGLEVGWSRIIEKTMVAIAGGTPPDVVTLWGFNTASWGSESFLVPIDEFIKETEIKEEDYFPVAWESINYDNHIWGLPIYISMGVMYYNKDRFEEVGLDPESPPVTIAQLDSYNDKLVSYDEKGDLKTMGFIPWKLANPWVWGYVFGGDYYDYETGKITANDPKIVESLEWVISYNEKFGGNKVSAFQTGFGRDFSFESPFYTGKLGLYQSGEYERSWIPRYAPDLQYGLAFNPYPPGGREKSTAINSNLIAIPAGSKYPKQAFEFIKWLTGSEPAEEYCVYVATIPARKDLAYKPIFFEQPYQELFLEIVSSPNAKLAPIIPVQQMYQAELLSAIEYAVFGKKTAKEALDDVTAKIQKELDKYLSR